MEWYYVIVPYEDNEMPLRKYMLGPYRTYGGAQEVSDKVGGWEILPLPVKDLDEAIRMLSEVEE